VGGCKTAFSLSPRGRVQDSLQPVPPWALMPGVRRRGSRLCYNKKIICFFRFEQRYACCGFTCSDIWFLN